MVLAEVLIEKQNIKNKIKQLKNYLDRAATISTESANEATSKLLDLIDKYRSHLILINKINNSTEVKIGDSKVSLANAILIIDTIKRKVDLLNSLIDNEESVLHVFSLMNNRDRLFAEYTVISNELKAIEWGIEVD